MKTELFIQQYIAVKAEMLAAISAQHVIMTYSLAATAAIFTGLLAIWDDQNLRVAVLAMAPLFLIFVWFIWEGEVLRMARAARFIWELEKMVNPLLAGRQRPSRPGGAADGSDLDDAAVLHWESWVRGENRWSRHLHLGPSYMLSSAVLVSLAIFSMSLAVVFAVISADVETPVRVLAFCATPAFLVLLFVAIVSLVRNPLMKRGMDGR